MALGTAWEWANPEVEEEALSPASLASPFILKLKPEEETLINASNSNGQGKEYIYINMYHRTSLYKLFLTSN